MWEAVFGDMGVAIIAIFNSMRVMKWLPVFSGIIIEPNIGSYTIYLGQK
jgi:hypothetical protein